MEKTGTLKNRSCVVFFTIILFAVLAYSEAYAAEANEVVLEGDEVVYEQKEDVAYAEGNVRLRYKDIRVYADRVVYKTMENTVEATGSGDSQVVLIQGAQELKGSSLFFDMTSGKGELHDAYGKYPAERGYVYANEGTVRTIQVSSLDEENWLRSPVRQDVIEGERVYRWQDTALTSCPEEPSHYSLVSGKIVVLPGYRAIVQKPRLYLKEHYILTYPFDYIIDLREKQPTSPLVPAILYDSDKGVGAMWGSTFGAYPFTARWKAIYWTEEDLESYLSMEYALNEDLSVYTHLERSWDSERDEKRSRPRWGTTYALGEWRTRLEWAEAQTVNIEKALGDTFKGVLWKSPEFTLESPRYPLPGEIGSLDFVAAWGSYEALSVSGRETSADRIAGRVRLSGSTKVGDVTPFWSASYWHYSYDNASGSGAGRDLPDSQKRTDVGFGVRWPVGDIEMVTSWRQRWVYGGSPMQWDRYSDQKDLYQAVTVPLFGNWKFTTRAGYNVRTENLDEMYYSLVYDNDCCYSVQIRFRDDRSRSDDDWAELRLVIDAFPSHPFFLGGPD